MKKNPSWRVDVAAERKTRTRQRLVAAAARVVSELGERARIEDFVSAAGISRGSFYNYYSSREELLDEVWACVGSQPFHDIQKQLCQVVDPAERLAAETRLILRRAIDEPIWGWLVYSLSADRKVPPDLLSFPRPDLILGHRQGRFQFPSLDCANDLVVSVLRQAVRSTLERERGDDYATGIVEMLLCALGLDHKEAHTIARRRLELMQETGPAAQSMVRNI